MPVHRTENGIRKGTPNKSEMLHKELRVSTTAQQDSITPPTGKRIRVFTTQCSMLVTTALTSTLRGSLSFGVDGVSNSDKVLASCRIEKGDDATAIVLSGLDVVGEINEKVTLTNITFSGGAAITRSVVYYKIVD